MERGTSTLTRRGRLERIATAERDRRAGRVALAIAALGEASEWPARAVLALARLPEADTNETRRILEEGLDRWAEEAGLDPLDESPVEATEATSSGGAPIELDAPSRPEAAALSHPIDHGELERAFAEAEAQTDEMHGANDVAERVLMQEPFGLAELDGDVIEAFDASETSDISDDAEASLALDAGPAGEEAWRGSEIDAASAPIDLATPDVSSADAPSREMVLATLDRWLRNLEGRNAGRAR